MKIAFVYDRVNKIGGAERVLLELHKIWPDAPLFTAVYNPKTAPWAREFRIIPSFLQYFPFARTHHEWFAWLTPLAFSTFSFDNYDVVLSVTSAEAKGVITKPDTLHVCYCLTPTRYLWSGAEIYHERTGFGVFDWIAKKVFSFLLPILRDWDRISSQRPDVYLAISKRVQERILKYYKRETQAVIYPPVNTDFAMQEEDNKGTNDYYLVVSRLVPYKRIDIVVAACTRLQKKLIVIGTGPEEHRLKRIAGVSVQFIDHYLTDKALFRYYQNCRAFLYAGDEDFGIVAGEAQAFGKPVIAYKESGVSEIIVDGKTGILFASQTVESLEEALKQFETIHFSPEPIQGNAAQFSSVRFRNEMKKSIEYVYKDFLTKHTS